MGVVEKEIDSCGCIVPALTFSASMAEHNEYRWSTRWHTYEIRTILVQYSYETRTKLAQ